jgi:hypothetical protein
MIQNEFESVLSAICNKLRLEARDKPFRSASDFEIRVRQVADELLGPGKIDFSPPAQAFPDLIRRKAPRGVFWARLVRMYQD